MHGILVSLFPLIALIVVGYVLKRTAYLNDGFWAGAEKLNYYILFPAMLFGNLATAQIDLSMVNTIMIILAVMFGLSCAVLYLFKRIRLCCTNLASKAYSAI